jgi:hypothetical protein
MKIINKIIITLFLLAFASQGLVADYIHLTNTSGKSIEVKIFSINEGKVKLQIRGDYKTYDYPLTQLDSASQTLVQELLNPKPVNTVELDPNHEYDIDLVSEYRKLKLNKRKQGTRGTVYVLSFTTILDYTFAKHGSRDPISPEFLIWAGHESSGRSTDEDDTWYSEIKKSLQTYGIVTEKDFRYNSRGYKPSVIPDTELIEIAKQNLEILNNANLKIIAMHNSKTKTKGLEDEHIKQIIQLLDKGIPVTLGSSPPTSIFGYKGTGTNDKKGVFLAINAGNKTDRKLSYEYMKTVPHAVFYVEIDPDATIKLISK